MELESTRNAVFSLKYHLILVVKYRRKAFQRKAALDRLREIACAVGEPQGVRIVEMNGESDHVHFLISAKPRTELCKFVNAMKSASSRVLKKEFPEVAKAVFHREALWSPSYFICTVGGAPIEVLKQYIEQQAAPEAH
jgi:putative transposase